MRLFLDDFWSAVASFESKQEAKNFFSDFLTPTERKMFAKRFQILMMLLLDYNYSEIKNRVRVSDSTIARMNNWLDERGKTLVKIGKRILSLKKRRKQRLSKTKKHLSGDLLSPLADRGANYLIRQFAKHKKKFSP